MHSKNITIGSIAVLVAFVALGCSDDSTVEDIEGTGGSMANVSGGNGNVGTGGGEAPGGAGGAGDSDSACGSDDDMRPPCRAERRAACAPLEEADCEADRFCSVLKAQKVDGENDCKAEQAEVVGCGLIGCSSSHTVATDLDEVAWVFPSGCVPLEWTEVSISDLDTCTDHSPE